MVRNLAVCCLAAVSALTIVGCTRDSAAESAPATETTAHTPTSAGPTTSKPADEPVSELPACGDIGTAATPPDCVLQSRDWTGFAFEVRHGDTGGSNTLTTITVLDAEGSTLQTITEKGWATPAGPRLRDLDDDGRDELIIPVFFATANTAYAVYHASGSALEYQRAGQLSGIGIDTSTSGYTITSARAGYASWDVAFWTFIEDRLHQVVTAEVRPIEGSDGKVAGTVCKVVDAGGLSDTGLSLDEARTQFCAEPAVVRISRN